MRAATHRWHSAVTAAAEESALNRRLEEAKHNQARVGTGAAAGSQVQHMPGSNRSAGTSRAIGLRSEFPGRQNLYRKVPKTLYSE